MLKASHHGESADNRKNMPVAFRFKSSKITSSAEKIKPKPKEAPEERWWFPIGSTTRVGAGVFGWHCVGRVPKTGRWFIFSGRLGLYDGVGHLFDEDMDSGEVDEDPSQSWFDILIPFPYAHMFYDISINDPGIELGLWFCIPGHYDKTRDLVVVACSTDRD